MVPDKKGVFNKKLNKNVIVQISEEYIKRKRNRWSKYVFVC